MRPVVGGRLSPLVLFRKVAGRGRGLDRPALTAELGGDAAFHLPPAKPPGGGQRPGMAGLDFKFQLAEAFLMAATPEESLVAIDDPVGFHGIGCSACGRFHQGPSRAPRDAHDSLIFSAWNT